jgi:pSer/pThr/pTyr-binding forkhead associated (FHA) protein
MIVQLVVAAGNRAGQMIPISTEKFIIGRALDCHLKPTSELISRYHCAILVGDEVVVRDLGSRNGVRINGDKINAEQQVTNGDKLTVGPLEFFIRILTDTEVSAGQPAGKADAHWDQQSDGSAYSESLPETLIQNPS